MYLANLHKHKRCKLSVNPLSIDGQTTLKESVIGSTSDDNGTNITTTINKIIDTAAEAVEGGGIKKLRCEDGSVTLNGGSEASTDVVDISAKGGGGWDPSEIEWLGLNESISVNTTFAMQGPGAGAELNWGWYNYKVDIPTKSLILMAYVCAGGDDASYASNMGWVLGYTSSKTHYNVIPSSTIYNHVYFLYCGVYGSVEFYQPYAIVDGQKVKDGNIIDKVPGAHPEMNYDIYIPDKKLFTVKKNSNLTPKDLNWTYYVDTYEQDKANHTHKYKKMDISDFAVEGWNTNKVGVNYFTLRCVPPGIPNEEPIMYHKIPYVVE